jgi:hypothetical protein
MDWFAVTYGILATLSTLFVIACVAAALRRGK